MSAKVLLLPAVLLSSLLVVVVFQFDPRNIRDLGHAVEESAGVDGLDQKDRDLQVGSCSDGNTPDDAWHPVYSAGWTNGYCSFTKDCNSPAFNTELACCKGAYAGQISGVCLSQLPSPPTLSPTESGDLDFYYPDYDTAWPEAGCINTRPMPSGRPQYSTMLACCKAAYGGQLSGKCLGQLPSPPTTSPTGADGGDVWYPDYETAWSAAGCINSLPLPFGPGDRPTFGTQLECCKAAYGGQVSGMCLSQLPSPPTTAPTGAGGADFWYPDYDTAWPEAGCLNELPLPFLSGGRPTYDTQLECCKAAYGGQVSGMCLSQLPSPPTTSPTGTGGGDVFYPDYLTAWSVAGCTNKLPIPDGRPTYETQLDCCKAAYGGQTSGMCLSQLPSPPTTSPTGVGGADVWYPDYATAWSEAGCTNKLPMPNGRPTYDTQLDCCKAAYGGQTSGMCLSQLPSPPTTSPTGAGGGDAWYPDYDTAWSVAGCTNKLPIPDGRPTYETQLDCCKAAYGGQTSGMCISQLPSPPTTSPTGAGGGDTWYPDYDTAWSEAGCTNKLPLPSGRPAFATQLDCCKAAYGGQVSGMCLSQLPSPPTTSPTGAGGGDAWYPDYLTAWSEAGCTNELPIPSGRPTYTTQLACCQGAYGGQMSGKCLSELPSPPTTSPTAAGGADFWYPDHGTAWSEAGCLNELPLPFAPGDRPTYDTQLDCCKAAYGGQTSGMCISQLASPPTSSPTSSLLEAEFWYPDYDTAWSVAGCSNALPLPYNDPSDRPQYDTQLACCKGSYGGQMSGMCISQLPSPPTTSPTEA